MARVVLLRCFSIFDAMVEKTNGSGGVYPRPDIEYSGFNKVLPEKGVPFVSSWSGGKDSCLALHRSIRSGAIPACLLTILHENGERSRAHGLSRRVLQAQASRMDIPMRTRMASWSQYEAVFVAVLRELKKQGIEGAVFGDIDLDGHLEWEQKVCRQAGLKPYLPLWKASRKNLLDDFVSSGFKSLIVAVRDSTLSRDYLGRILDQGLINEFIRIGIDPSGEAGEYHTVVTDGPVFSEQLQLRKGKTVFRSGYWCLDVLLAN